MRRLKATSERGRAQEGGVTLTADLISPSKPMASRPPSAGLQNCDCFSSGGDGDRADSLASVAAAPTSALNASPNHACGPILAIPGARCRKGSRRGRPDIISAGFRNMVKTNWEREEADPGCSPEVSALHTPRPSAHTSLQLAGLAQCLS